MKRFIRNSGRVFLGLCGLFLAGGILTLDRVDHQPYFAEEYYLTTSKRLERLRAPLAVRGELLAGFGRAILTPQLGASNAPESGVFQAIPLAGYGDRKGKPASGAHDPLTVKGVAFRVRDSKGEGEKTAVMISADALIIPREVADLAVESLKRKAGLTREQIYFSATHTHASLGGWAEGFVGEAFAGEFQKGVREWFAAKLAEAGEKALADMRPAKLGHGKVGIPEYTRNRLAGGAGQIDPEFSLIVLQQKEGKSAIVGSYSAHATVLSSKVMEFSGDYPGAWQRAMEAKSGGMAVFLAGGVGSHSPVAPESGFEGVEQMGERLAERVAESLPAIALTNEVTLGWIGLPTELPELHTRISESLRLRPWLARSLVRTGNQTFLQAVRLNDVVWISTPCDFSGELAIGIKQFAREQGLDAVITSFNGDYIGYVIPHKYYGWPGYEPRVMSFFGPNVPGYFDELIRAMVTQLGDLPRMVRSETQ